MADVPPPPPRIEKFLGSWISVFSWQMYSPPPTRIRKKFLEGYFPKVRFELADVPPPGSEIIFLKVYFPLNATAQYSVNPDFNYIL